MFDNTNPYKLRIEIMLDQKHYYASFQNAENQTVEIEIAPTVADWLFQKFVRKERNLRRSDERNLEHSEVTEQTLYERVINRPKSLEEIALERLQNEMLWKGINVLPKVQRRRLILYYFENFTYEQIAKIEGCSARAVKYSVDSAKANLKNFIEKN